MPSWYVVTRWIHVLSATTWVGEVLTLNVVLLPAFLAMKGPERVATMHRIMPRVFKLASVLAVTAVLSGGVLLTLRFRHDWGALLTTPSGRAYLVGATLGTAVAAFHLFLEPRLEGELCSASEHGHSDVDERLLRRLHVVPRVALGIVVAVALLMMIATRGW